MRKPRPIKPIDASVQRRLDNLERLIDAEYDGKPAEFERKTGVRMSQVGQWFSGYTALRENAVKTLEEKTNKPEGFFDRQHYKMQGEAGVYVLQVQPPGNQASLDAIMRTLRAEFMLIPEDKWGAALIDVLQALSDKHHRP